MLGYFVIISSFCCFSLRCWWKL